MLFRSVGMFSINECVMERFNESRALAHQPYVRADCELAWITITAEPWEKRS